jgi:Cellulase (glycosyl hydrolase family 5)
MMGRSFFYLCTVLVLGFAIAHDRGEKDIGQRLDPPSQPIPRSLFGLHIHHLTDTTPWPAVPFGTWRLWDAYASWPNVEPQKNQWNFSRVDQYVSLAESHGVEVLLPLGLSPTWASARPAERCPYGPGNAAEPARISDWQDYVRQVATRYKGRVHAYEIWNEPNLPDFFSGTPETMLLLAREAYQILKQVDSTVVVVSPSATGPPGAEWLDRYLRLGGGGYADVIGFHFYVTPGAPEAMVTLARKVKAVMAENGLAGKPLWNTEAGWFIENRLTAVRPREGSFSRVLTLDEASAYVARCYLLNWALGISRFYFYSWDSEVGGLTEEDGKTLKPPSTAYAEIETWLVGARMISCFSDSENTWICELGRAGYRGWIIWNPGQTIKFNIPQAWPVARARDLAGNRRSLGSHPIVSIGPSPLLLESEAL